VGSGVRATERNGDGSGRAPKEAWSTGWARAGTAQAMPPTLGTQGKGGGCATAWAWDPRGHGRGRDPRAGARQGSRVWERERRGHDGGMEGVDAFVVVLIGVV
jgi:hypothetical protein